MEVERTKLTLQTRDNVGPPAKKIFPARVVKTASSAAVFKKQNNRGNRGNGTPQANFSNLKFTAEDADATTLLSARSHSSSRSAEKKGAKKRHSDVHPLGMAFSGTV
jgi:hypothetical protein